jgi:hypothetical protein
MWHAWERGETCTGFWWESPKERDHLGDRCVDGRMGSKWTLGRLFGGVEWIQLAQDRDRWRSVVNAVMNLRVLAPRSELENGIGSTDRYFPPESHLQVGVLHKLPVIRKQFECGTSQNHVSLPRGYVRGR